MQDLTYCLLCKKNTKNINPKVVKTKIIDSLWCQSALCVIKTSLDLLKSKKQKDY